MARRKSSEGEAITLGFDGSRGRRGGRRAKPDATALVACTMDGHLVALGVWEAPDGPSQEQWTPPLPEIEAAVADAFRRYKVVAMYADPARDWRSYVNNWEAKWGRRLKVRVRADHPIEWWMTGGRALLVERAVEAFAAGHDIDLADSYAYSDSLSDLPMLRAVGHPVAVNPDRALAQVAADEGWQTKRFERLGRRLVAVVVTFLATVAGFGASRFASRRKSPPRRFAVRR